MARKSQPKIDTSGLYLWVREDSTRDYFHITCTVVSADLKEKVLYEAKDWNAPEDLKHFRGFKITAQGNNDDQDGLYGFTTVFRDVYEITLETAESMVYILERVKRGLDAYEAEYSWPATFGLYVSVITKALGIEWFLFDRTPTEYNETPFSLDGRRYGMNKIDRMVSDWQKKKEENFARK